eukprot:c20504_g1_i2 orf=104-388(-)
MQQEKIQKINADMRNEDDGQQIIIEGGHMLSGNHHQSKESPGLSLIATSNFPITALRLLIGELGFGTKHFPEDAVADSSCTKLFAVLVTPTGEA